MVNAPPSAAPPAPAVHRSSACLHHSSPPRHHWSWRRTGRRPKSDAPPALRQNGAEVRGVIELLHVTKRYGPVTALEDLTLEVHEGEIFGLLGPNGAGKTTTLRLVAGLARPTQGQVRVAGLDPWQRGEPVRRQMGVVLDGGLLYDSLTVRENLLLFAGLFGVREQAVRDAMVQMDIADLRDRLAGRLSKGQRQRVALARALLHGPRLLYLDEPTSGLDPLATDDLHRLIGNLRGQGITILLSSHDMAEVEALCDRVCILQRGRMIACGTPAELKARHGPSLTDAFIQLTRRGC
ncbi:MAG: ABC transporter ATP-binding protein [Symbiobacterium thermophilum]|uniref:ABC transporter ATP-binding protein n=1 Tax=Symbiobacterium thermophilum TaxID=2734 RepID=A0A953IDS0_SYMTR|nr:ABC transporter ATP-binding protein [Symbiobacterium thermophilum]